MEVSIHRVVKIVTSTETLKTEDREFQIRKYFVTDKDGVNFEVSLFLEDDWTETIAK